MAFPSGEPFCMASHSPICAHLVSLRAGVFRKNLTTSLKALGHLCLYEILLTPEIRIVSIFGQAAMLGKLTSLLGPCFAPCLVFCFCFGFVFFFTLYPIAPHLHPLLSLSTLKKRGLCSLKLKGPLLQEALAFPTHFICKNKALVLDAK